MNKDQEKEIVFKGDILKVVAAKLGMSIEEAEKHYQFMVKGIQDTLWDPTLGTLTIPKIGNLYFRVGKAKKYLKIGTPEKRYYKVIEERVKHVEQDRVDRNLVGKNNIHLIPPVTLCTNLVGRRSLQEIEEFQNKHYDKHKKAKDHSGILY